MKLETRNAIFKQMDSNYALVRDEDWEVLCLVWRDSEGYYALYMEHYSLSKNDVENILDKSSTIALIPVVDEEAKSQYKKELKKEEQIIKNQLEQLWND